MKFFLLEAVDPEERKLRLRKVYVYAKRNKAAMQMAPTSNPHQKVHHFVRWDHASRIVGAHASGVKPKVRRMLVSGRRQNRKQFRKAQAVAVKKAKGKELMNHAAHKLTDTGGWIAYRNYLKSQGKI